MSASPACAAASGGRPAPRDLEIARALASRATAVGALAPGRWEVTLRNGARLDVRARFDAGWLLLDAPPHAGAPPTTVVASTRQLLHWNATFGGGARVVLQADEQGPLVRADVPLDEAVGLGGRVVEALSGVEAAISAIAGAVGGMPGDSTSVPAVATVDVPGGGAADLGDLCRQTGWDVVERAAGGLAVDLDVPGAFHQASITTRADATVAAWVPVVDATGASPAPSPDVCQRAVALLLLRVGGIVRMARPAAETRDGATEARFEVVFDSGPCAAELAHALAALSLACRLASREAAVLQHDEVVARAYVSQWERASAPGHH